MADVKVRFSRGGPNYTQELVREQIEAQKKLVASQKAAFAELQKADDDRIAHHKVTNDKLQKADDSLAKASIDLTLHGYKRRQQLAAEHTKFDLDQLKTRERNEKASDDKRMRSLREDVSKRLAEQHRERIALQKSYQEKVLAHGKAQQAITNAEKFSAATIERLHGTSTKRLINEYKSLQDRKQVLLDARERAEGASAKRIVDNKIKEIAREQRAYKSVALERGEVLTGGAGAKVGILGTGRQLISQSGLPGAGLLAKGALATGGVLAVGVGMQKAISLALEYEDALADIRAITGLSENDAKSLGDQLQILGQQKGISAAEGINAAKLAISAMGPAIAKNEKLLVGFSDNILTLAKISGVDVSTATNLLTTTLNQFQLPASESGRIMNVMAAAAKEGAAEIPDLGAAMVEVGATAKLLKVPVEGAAAAIEILSMNGIKGAQSGTMYRNVLGFMSTGTKEAEKALKSMGLTFRDINPAIVGQEKGLATLKGALDKIQDPVQKSSILMDLFRKENQNAAVILMENNKQLGVMQRNITGTTEAQTQLQIKQNTTSEQWKRMVVGAENLGIGIGTALVKTATAAIGVFGDLTSVFSGTSGKVDDLKEATAKYNAEISRNSKVEEHNDHLRQLADRYDELTVKTDRTTEENKELNIITGELDSATGRVASTINDYGNTVAIQTEKVRAFADQQDRLSNSMLNAAKISAQQRARELAKDFATIDMSKMDDLQKTALGEVTVTDDQIAKQLGAKSMSDLAAKYSSKELLDNVVRSTRERMEYMRREATLDAGAEIVETSNLVAQSIDAISDVALSSLKDKYKGIIGIPEQNVNEFAKEVERTFGITGKKLHLVMTELRHKIASGIAPEDTGGSTTTTTGGGGGGPTDDKEAKKLFDKGLKIAANTKAEWEKWLETNIKDTRVTNEYKLVLEEQYQKDRLALAIKHNQEEEILAARHALRLLEIQQQIVSSATGRGSNNFIGIQRGGAMDDPVRQYNRDRNANSTDNFLKGLGYEPKVKQGKGLNAFVKSLGGDDDGLANREKADQEEFARWQEIISPVESAFQGLFGTVNEGLDTWLEKTFNLKSGFGAFIAGAISGVLQFAQTILAKAAIFALMSLILPGSGVVADGITKFLGFSEGGIVPQYFASGGMMGAAQSIRLGAFLGKTFKPRGTDTIPAMLTPGEGVLNKGAMKMFGASNLHAMNKAGARYLAAGGTLTDTGIAEGWTFGDKAFNPKNSGGSSIAEGWTFGDKIGGGSNDNIWKFDHADQGIWKWDHARQNSIAAMAAANPYSSGAAQSMHVQAARQAENNALMNSLVTEVRELRAIMSNPQFVTSYDADAINRSNNSQSNTRYSRAL